MSEFSTTLAQARDAMPLRRLMEHFGKSPGAKCPFCGREGSSAFFMGKEGEMFKCHNTGNADAAGCSTGNRALDQVGFLRLELNLPDSEQGEKEAAIALMEMTGVVSKSSPAPSSTLIDAPGGNNPEPCQEKADLTPKVADGELEPRARNPEAPKTVDWAAIQAVYKRGNDTYRTLSAQFGVSFHTIAKRAKRGEWRKAGEIAIPDGENVTAKKVVDGEIATPGGENVTAKKVVDGEIATPGGENAAAKKGWDGEIANPDGENAMAKKGLVGEIAPRPCAGLIGCVACGKPALWQHPDLPDAAFCAECQKLAAESFLPNNWSKLPAPGIASGEVTVPTSLLYNDVERAGADVAIKRLEARIDKESALGWKVAKLEKLLWEARWGVEVYDSRKHAEATAKKAERDAQHAPGLRALNYFYDKLGWDPKDEKDIQLRYGLSKERQRFCGYRSNTPANLEILRKLPELFDWPEILASGLYLPADERHPAPRPNLQFCGVGRIRKLKAGETAGEGEWVEEDGWLWGVCVPILIPYRDEAGRLIGLRPHKGMGPAGTRTGTPHWYVPRAAGARVVEEYDNVMITDCELMAAAFLDICEGRTGVGAIPGIIFSDDLNVREELDGWLVMGQCCVVKMSFLPEDNPDQPIAGPLESEVCECYLREKFEALDISCDVYTPPDDWVRDAITTWDNCPATIIHGSPPPPTA